MRLFANCDSSHLPIASAEHRGLATLSRLLAMAAICKHLFSAKRLLASRWLLLLICCVQPVMPALLSQGRMLCWNELKNKNILSEMKHRGIAQFLSLYRTYEDISSEFLFGDEIEYFICQLGPTSNLENSGDTPHAPQERGDGVARLILRAPELIDQLRRDPLSNIAGAALGWHPEYASWMVEGTPARPYKGTPRGLMEVENSMLLRRKILKRNLKAGEEVFTLSTFPRIGCTSFTFPSLDPSENRILGSTSMPDQVVEEHPRFSTASRSIMQRRGSKVDIRVPRMDSRSGRHGPPVAQPLKVDATAFGMGAGCLQVTMQAGGLHDARRLYDAMAVMAPLLLALTAGSPIWQGEVLGVDARWGVLEQAVDDRTPGERGEGPLGRGEQRLRRSRYCPVECYIGGGPGLDVEQYNDLEVAVDAAAYQQLRAAGVDELLARHVAHLFTRDPLVVAEETLAEGEEAAGLWEAVQSTNWNSVRFKPPPPRKDNSHNIGWRVEVRPMELSVSDAENAAFAVFVALLAQALHRAPLDLYLPMSLLHANMRRAQAPGAARTQQFFYRQGGADGGRVREMTLAEIFCGAQGTTGLVAFVRGFLSSSSSSSSSVSELESATAAASSPEDAHARRRLEAYLDFVEAKARGQVPTTAEWMRTVVSAHHSAGLHPASRLPPRGPVTVSEGLCHLLLAACEALQRDLAASRILLSDLPTALAPRRPALSEFSADASPPSRRPLSALSRPLPHEPLLGRLFAANRRPGAPCPCPRALAAPRSLLCSCAPAVLLRGLAQEHAQHTPSPLLSTRLPPLQPSPHRARGLRP